MFPGTKNRPPKMTSKHENAYFYMADQTNKTLQNFTSFRKGSPDPTCLRFSVFESSEAQECRLPVGPALLTPTKPLPHLTSSFPGGTAEPSPSSAGWPGLSEQALAGCTPEQQQCLHLWPAEPAMVREV